MSNALVVHRGEEKFWQVTVTEDGAPIDLTGAAVYFEVRRSYPPSAGEASALISKTSVGNAGMWLTDPAAGTFELQATKADTNTMTPGGYMYGIEYVPAGSSDPRVLVIDKFQILPDMVRVV